MRSVWSGQGFLDERLTTRLLIRLPVLTPTMPCHAGTGPMSAAGEALILSVGELGRAGYRTDAGRNDIRNLAAF